MNKFSVFAALSVPSLAFSLAAALPAEAQNYTLQKGKRFTMEIINTHTGLPMKVPVSCDTLNSAMPDAITYGMAAQFHIALSNGGNMGDFAKPSDEFSSGNPLMEHMMVKHDFAVTYGKMLRKQATPSEIEAYKANPVGGNPVFGAVLWCVGDSSKLAPDYKLQGNDIVLAK